jgi:hypothetical protein
VTLSLNTALPNTPFFSSLIEERGAPLPEFDPWDPTYQPTFDLRGIDHEFAQLLTSVSLQIAEVANHGTQLLTETKASYRQVMEEWTAEYRQVMEGLGLPLPKQREVSMLPDPQLCPECLDAGHARRFIDGCEHNSGALTLSAETIDVLSQLDEIERSGFDEEQDERVLVVDPRDGSDIEFISTAAMELGQALLVPSRAAMRNSCATCFPHECDPESPRMMCRRSAPLTSGRHMAVEPIQDVSDTDFFEAVGKISTALLADVDPADVQAECVITTVPNDFAETGAAQFLAGATRARNELAAAGQEREGIQNSCPLDGEPLASTVMEVSRPTIYRHVDGTSHEDRSGELRVPTAPACTGEVNCEATAHTSGCFAETLDVSRLAAEAHEAYTQIDSIDAPVKVWFCPDRRNHIEKLVEWDGDVAYCMETGCTNSSENTCRCNPEGAPHRRGTPGCAHKDA